MGSKPLIGTPEKPKEIKALNYSPCFLIK